MLARNFPPPLAHLKDGSTGNPNIWLFLILFAISLIESSIDFLQGLKYQGVYQPCFKGPQYVFSKGSCKYGDKDLGLAIFILKILFFFHNSFPQV